MSPERTRFTGTDAQSVRMVSPEFMGLWNKIRRKTLIGFKFFIDSRGTGILRPPFQDRPIAKGILRILGVIQEILGAHGLPILTARFQNPCNKGIPTARKFRLTNPRGDVKISPQNKAADGVRLPPAMGEEVYIVSALLYVVPCGAACGDSRRVRTRRGFDGA